MAIWQIDDDYYVDLDQSMVCWKQDAQWHQKSLTPLRQKAAQRYLFIRQNSKYPIDQPLIDHEYSQPDPQLMRSGLLAAKKDQQDEE